MKLSANIVYDFYNRHRDRRDPSTYTQKLGETIKRWREVAESGYRSLTYRRGPGFLVVNDRRPGFEKADYQFADVEAKIYLACDAGTTAERIHAQLSADDDDPPDVDESGVSRRVGGFQSNVSEGGIYLSLAVAANANVAPAKATQATAVTVLAPLSCTMHRNISPL